MKSVLALVALGALAATSQRDAWTELHASIFLRTAPDGETYGEHELDPLLWPSSRWLTEPERRGAILEALGKLNRADAAQRSVRERLVMQRDLWAVFDWVAARDPESPLAAALARAMRDVSATVEELRAFKCCVDGVADVPGGLLDASQGWVRIADESGRPIAPLHDHAFDGRSYFEVLIRLPEGRAQTTAWLQELRVEPGLIADTAGSKRVSPDLPQLPNGTQLAIVRRALAVATSGEAVVSDLVESVQVRQILANDVPRLDDPVILTLEEGRDHFVLAQAVREFRLGRSGARALDEFGPNELDFGRLGSHGPDPFTQSKASWDAQEPGLVNCSGCHAQPGVYSVNSLTRVSSGPGSIFMMGAKEGLTVPLPSDGSKARAAALAFKRRRPSWKALKSHWKSSPR